MTAIVKSADTWLADVKAIIARYFETVTSKPGQRLVCPLTYTQAFDHLIELGVPPDFAAKWLTIYPKGGRR